MEMTSIFSLDRTIAPAAANQQQSYPLRRGGDGFSFRNHGKDSNHLLGVPAWGPSRGWYIFSYSYIFSLIIGNKRISVLKEKVQRLSRKFARDQRRGKIVSLENWRANQPTKSRSEFTRRRKNVWPTRFCFVCPNRHFWLNPAGWKRAQPSRHGQSCGASWNQLDWFSIEQRKSTRCDYSLRAYFRQLVFVLSIDLLRRCVFSRTPGRGPSS